MKGKRASSGALVVLFGDQLDASSRAVREIDASRDTVLMMEVREESTHVPSHAQRTILFLSAMRHFTAELEAAGVRVRYVKLDDPENTQTFTGEVGRAAKELRPRCVRSIRAGEHRVRAMVESWSGMFGVPVEVLEDEHFLTSAEEFERWAEGRRELTMEYFYRHQRARLGVMVDEVGKPVGGTWNMDSENRQSFGKAGPVPKPPRPKRFEPDAITREVMEVVARELPDLPGSAAGFCWPVTREEALEALDDFIKRRLAMFGPYEDAMWTGEPFVYHSVLSALLNLKLLNPRECVERAVAALEKEHAPIQSVEGFVRQVIGWREFIRGVYDSEGAEYGARNSLGQDGKLPQFFWSGKTEMNCLKHCIGEVLERGFGHHIQRLIVIGNFALIAGIHPRAVTDWFLGMYVDGVDWVTVPNTLGMSQHADGRRGSTVGVVGTKPYAASGKYIKKMSNYCTGCGYDVEARTGAKACPFNTFYWDFLIRHEKTFRTNHRMKMILSQVAKMKPVERVQITVSAAALRAKFGIAGDDDGSRVRAGPSDGLFD